MNPEQIKQRFYEQGQALRSWALAHQTGAGMNRPAIALLTAQQLHRICAEGGQIELTLAGPEEGPNAWRRVFLHLTGPHALRAFQDAVFNESAVALPAGHLKPGGWEPAQQVVVFGLLQVEHGEMVIDSIHGKSKGPGGIPNLTGL